MSDLMREEFEAAFRKQFGFGRMTASANADADQMLKAAEWAWKASRECMVIELPKPIELEVVGVGCTFHSEYLHGHAVVDAIHAAGVKTK